MSGRLPADLHVSGRHDNERIGKLSEFFTLGGDLRVRRLGFGAMQITGPGIWGEPVDRDEAIRGLRRAVEAGVSLIDTVDAYGPFVSENLIKEALYPVQLEKSSSLVERRYRWVESMSG